MKRLKRKNTCWKNSSRETFMETINNIGVIRKKWTMSVSLFVFFLVSIIFICWFFRRLFKAKQGFRLCLYQKTQDTNQGFQVPVTAGEWVWCGAVCRDVVSGDNESMCLGGLLPDRFRSRFTPGPGADQSALSHPQGLCACLCWRPVKGQQSQAGSFSNGWKGRDSREKKNKKWKHN